MVRATGTKMWVWGAVAALTIGMVGIGGPATAAPPGISSAPVATADAAVHEDGSVTVTYTINRVAKLANPTVTCTLDDPPVSADCGAPTGSTKKLTTYTTELTGLDDGPHTFTVTFDLTDGGTAKASVSFTIDTVPLTLEQTCTAQNGYLIAEPWFSEFECYPQGDPPSALAAGALEALDPYCAGLIAWNGSESQRAFVRCHFRTLEDDCADLYGTLHYPGDDITAWICEANPYTGSEEASLAYATIWMPALSEWCPWPLDGIAQTDLIRVWCPITW